MSPAGQLRIGISGWRYPPWRARFYPEDLPQRRELEYASRQVNSIELNGSFYSLQRPGSFQEWFETTPDDFLFSIKGGRFITHMKKLRDIEKPLANFYAQGILALRHKLGPFLWQFPPNLGYDHARFDHFFRLLPRTAGEALELARGHDHRLEGRAYLETDDPARPLRHCVEIRHESFINPEFIALLREHNVAFVLADTAQLFPYVEDVTADFIYIRLHGDVELYASGYSDEALDWWAARIRSWRRGAQPRDARRASTIAPPGAKARDVYVYFDNDAKVHAPFNAIDLAKKLGLSK